MEHLSAPIIQIFMSPATGPVVRRVAGLPTDQAVMILSAALEQLRMEAVKEIVDGGPRRVALADGTEAALDLIRRNGGG